MSLLVRQRVPRDGDRPPQRDLLPDLRHQVPHRAPNRVRVRAQPPRRARPHGVRMVQQRRLPQRIQPHLPNKPLRTRRSRLSQERRRMRDVRQELIEQLPARDKVRLAVQLDHRRAHPAPARAPAHPLREHLHPDEALPGDAVRELRGAGGAGGRAVGVEPGERVGEGVVAGGERLAGFGERDAFGELAELGDELDGGLGGRGGGVEAGGEGGGSAGEDVHCWLRPKGEGGGGGW